MSSQSISVQENIFSTDVTLVENLLDYFQRSVSFLVVCNLNLMLAKSVVPHVGQGMDSTAYFAFSFAAVSQVVTD